MFCIACKVLIHLEQTKSFNQVRQYSKSTIKMFAADIYGNVFTCTNVTFGFSPCIAAPFYLRGGGSILFR